MILDEFPPGTLTFGSGEAELRERIRGWIDEHDPGPPPEEFGARLEALRDWQRELHAAGFVGLSWPERYGGSGLDLAAEAVLAEELATSSMPELINRIGVYMVGPTLMDLASEEQRASHLPGMLDASDLWCQGFSEPQAGSDLAAVRTYARSEGNELVVNGQKVWTSRAHTARYCSLLVRTDRDAARHRGLSMVILDMESAGVTVAPLPQILNEPHFNEVFLDDVRVPSNNVIGAVGEGWAVAMKMLSYERGLFVLERQIRLRRKLDELALALLDTGAARDQGIRERIGGLHVQLEVLRAQVYRTLASQRAGTLRPGATSVDKLLMTRVYQELFAVAVDALGPDVALGMNQWTHDLLDSRATSIYSGTTEIQLGIVSRQLLGLEAGR